MKQTEPRVFLIARPSLIWDERNGLDDYFDYIGAETWADARRMLDTDASGLDEPKLPGGYDAQTLIEVMGRMCYRSFGVDLNPNITRVRDDQHQYLENILGVGKPPSYRHGSVLEHAQYSFIFQDVSRVFTHELVRHRAGVAISQESMRFVRLSDLKVWLPEAIKQTPEHGPHSQHAFTDRGDRMHDDFLDSFVSIVEDLEEWQRKAAEHYGLDDEGVPFAYKKHVTSALRRLAPIGTATAIGWSANIRTLRHVISMRTNLGAEEEIRLVFDQVASIMREECPSLFGDYERDEDGQWHTAQWKV